MPLFDASPTLSQQAKKPSRLDTTFLDTVLKNKLAFQGVLRSLTNDSLTGDVLQKICDWFGITSFRLGPPPDRNRPEEIQMQVLHDSFEHSVRRADTHASRLSPSPHTTELASFLEEPGMISIEQRRIDPAPNEEEIDVRSLFFYTPASSFSEAATRFQTYRRRTPKEQGAGEYVFA